MVWSRRRNTSTPTPGDVSYQKLLVLQNGQRQTASDIPRDYHFRPDVTPATTLFLDGPGVFGHYTGHHALYYHIPGLRFCCLPLSGMLFVIVCFISFSVFSRSRFRLLFLGFRLSCGKALHVMSLPFCYFCTVCFSYTLLRLLLTIKLLII
jgi:hypothetical protein